MFKNPLGAGWGLLPTLWWVGSWLLAYLPSFFMSGKEAISQRESNRQPLHSEMGSSPLSPGSLGLSHIRFRGLYENIIQICKVTSKDHQHVTGWTWEH